MRLLLIATAAVLLLGACASGREDPGVAYKEAESVESLVVPPDLTKPSAPGALSVPEATTGASTEAGAGAEDPASGLLPEFENIRFVRAGASVWLELDDAAPDEVWPRLGSFLEAQGLEIAQADPALGIIQTEWSERYDSPPRGGLTGLFGRLFGGGGDPVLDRYQFALERMDDGGTRIVVAQHSAREVARAAERGAVGTGGSSRSFGWERSAGDPAVRAEMTKRLLVHLGLSERGAQGVIAQARGAAGLGPPARYFEDDWGRAWVMIEDRSLRRVFARVEQALAAIDAGITAAELDQRRLQAQWVPPSGNEPRDLAIHVRREDGAVQITAGDVDGPERSGEVHKALLRALTEALGGDPGDVRQPTAEEPGAEPEREPGRPRSIMSPRRR